MKIPALLMSKESRESLLLSPSKPNHGSVSNCRYSIMAQHHSNNTVNGLDELANLSGLSAVIRPSKDEAAQVEEHADRVVSFLVAEPHFREGTDELFAVTFSFADQNDRPRIANPMHLAHAYADAMFRALPEYRFSVRHASQVNHNFPILFSNPKRVTMFDHMQAIANPVFSLLREGSIRLLVIKSESYHFNWPREQSRKLQREQQKAEAQQ